MDWQPDGYVFYCDGKEVSRCNKHVSHVPQFILLTTEVQGYRSVKKLMPSCSAAWRQTIIRLRSRTNLRTMHLW